MLFTTRNVPWYKLPLLGVIILALVIVILPGMILSWFRRLISA